MGHGPVQLSDIADAIDGGADMMHFHLDRETGKIIMVTDEDIAAAEDEASAGDAPDWQQESIETARQIAADESNRFLPLPDKREANDWQIMDDFAADLADEKAAERLSRDIRGRGAFRAFKNRIRDLGLDDQWYAYRKARYQSLAKEWCRENGIQYE